MCLSASSITFYKLIIHLRHEDPNVGEVNAERSYDASHTAHHAAASHSLRPENTRSGKIDSSENGRQAEHDDTRERWNNLL